MQYERDDTPRDSDLAQVANLSDQLVQEEEAVAEATAVLAEKLAAYRLTAEKLLPEAMLATGLSEFTLTNGKKVHVDSRFVGSRLTDHEALTWLEENGAGHLIKATVKVELPAASVSVARELMDLLRSHHASNQFTSLTLDTAVHQSTIAAFAKELYEAGEMPDLEKLGVHRRVIARVGARRFRDLALTGLIRRD